MMNVNPTLMFVLVEEAMVVTIALIVMVILGSMRRSMERKNMAMLVARIQKQESGWLQRHIEFLKDNCRMGEEQAVVTATKLLKQRNQIYQQFINAYIQRKSSLLDGLESALEQLLESYRGSMAIVTDTDAAPSMEQAPVDADVSAKIDAMVKQVGELQAENDRLQSELRTAQKEAEDIMREYVSAYSGGHIAAPENKFHSKETVTPSLPNEAMLLQESPSESASKTDSGTTDPMIAAHLEQLRGRVKAG